MVPRKIRGACAEKFGGRWSIDRERGILKSDWTNVLKIQANPEGALYDVQFNAEGILDLSLTRADVQQLFDTPSCGNENEFMRSIAWNARALLQYRGAKSRLTSSYLKKFHLPRSILALQEVHKDRIQLGDYMCRLHRDAVVHASFCPGDVGGSAAGGVAAILPKLAFDLGVASYASAVVEGRALRVDVVGQGFQL
eukprot:1518768-Pyramimonas_sp.AAC.1